MTVFWRLWTFAALCSVFCSGGVAASEQTPASAVKPFRYIVRTGDSPSRLAHRWGIPQSLISKRDHVLKTGEVVTIPLAARVTVRRGGSLSEVSQKYGVSVEMLAKFNRLRPPYHVRAGKVIMVPALK